MDFIEVRVLKESRSKYQALPIYVEKMCIATATFTGWFISLKIKQ